MKTKNDNHLRNYPLPGAYNRAELAELETRAATHKLNAAAYIRQQLGFAPVKQGAPKGNQNAATNRQQKEK